MAQSAAAAIIDLNEFRRRRQPAPARASVPAQRATFQAPMWIVWVPVWIVA